ncbi:hypothetical protein Agub_g1064, partial [Astrephomene gubernaculifera]
QQTRAAGEVEMRLAAHQPPFCHRIIVSRAPGGVALLLDLMCLPVGRSYIKLSISAQPSAPAPDGAIKSEPGASGSSGGAPAAGGPGEALLRAVQQLVPARLGPEVVVSVGGRAAAHTGPGPRPAAAGGPGPGAPLWLLVPNGRVRQAVEVV